MRVHHSFLIALMLIAVMAAAIFIIAGAIIPGLFNTYQAAWSTIVSAVVGFGGLMIVTRLGFEESRKNISTQAQIDRRLRAEQRATDTKALAAGLAAELRACSFNLRAAERLVTSNARKGTPITVHTLSAITPPPISLYLAQLQNIGLLGELAGRTVGVYNEIQTSIRHDEVLCSQFERGGLAMNASDLEVDLRWIKRADYADALACSLENYKSTID